MKWKEIKDKIESLGVKDADEILYIDISSDINEVRDIEVTRFDKESGWEIDN